MITEVLKDAEQRMAKAIEALHKNLGSVRTGRANPALVDRVLVEYYGAPTPLNQLAGISAPESRTILIQPYDASSIGAIEKALRQSEQSFNPSNDGKVIRIAIPPLTEERRKQMVKIVHSNVEDGKVAIRNIRRDAISSVRDLLSAKEISEDDERKAGTELDSLTKKYTDEADKVGKTKEQEVLEV